MTLKQIKKILKSHNVPYYIKKGQIYADSMIGNTRIFEFVENVTHWTEKKLYNWLGY